MRPAVAFVTLGCPKNEVDSERMAARVASSGLRLVGDVEEADVVVLNTCAFILEAVEEAIDEFFKLHNEWRSRRPKRKIIVAGCLASRYGDALAQAMPEADGFLDVAAEDSIVEALGELLQVPVHPRPGPCRLQPAPAAYLKISDGCDRCCTYCMIPSIRGPYFSASPTALIEEAQWLIDHRAREIVLVGQDVSSYGTDLEPPVQLPDLIAKLDRLEGDFRIRLMYLQPDGITDRLLDAIACSSHVCRYLDIPLQHVSPPILRAMGRSGSADDFLRLLDRIRLAMPDVALRTTFMTGFPGETDADVAKMMQFLSEARFDYAGVFAFSAEEGTPAHKMPGHVRREVAIERARCVQELADEIGFACAASKVGTRQTVLVEGLDEDGEVYGRTCGQAPEVDGITLLEGRGLAPGAFVEAEIASSVGYDLVGVAV